MSEEIKGGISVETQHIFPVIKRWLYSEKEIFLREIVSNSCDAITKLKRLASLGKYDSNGESYKITVTADKELKTLTVSDNGIGMNAEEVQKYICQIALSGALDFISKYEGDKDSNAGGIIGHFGLGFYSCFMVSETVDVITKSFDGSPAVKWSCNEDGEYTIADAQRDCHGTDVVMHISESEEEFLSEYKLREVLEKYCSFMPVEIYINIIGDEKEEEHDHEHDEGCECDECKEEKKEKEEPKPINDTTPLWMKNASDCNDEDYKEFYHKVFNDYKDTLFHIHINAEYPLNFKGILYFPKINSEYDNLEGQVKLYYNQVFVADNIKEVIPEYMLMLKGVLDCPELPLNVSRSYLQNNGYVSKISNHIVKKVCDKINSLFSTDRENYEKMWDDLRIFIEYACIRDHKFYDRVKNSLILKLSDGKCVTIDEYLEAAKATNEGVIYYTGDKTAQAQYISLLASQGISVAVLDKLIDTQFINVIEQDKNIKFARVDSDVASALKGDGEEYKNDDLVALFKKVSGNEKLEVKFENLRDDKLPCILTVSEQSRRMEDMMKMYRMSGNDDFSMPVDYTLTLNANSEVIKKLADAEGEKAEASAKQLYNLALLSQRQLTADELKKFLSDSFDMIKNSL